MEVSELDKHEFAKLLSENLKSRTIVCRKGEVYALDHTASGMLWVIEKGSLITVELDESGREIGTGIYNSDMIIGISSFFENEHCTTCKPIQDTVLRAYQIKSVIRLLKENPEHCFYALQYAASLFCFSIDFLKLNTFSSLEGRLAWFEKLVREYTQEDQLDIPDTLIAGFLGIHPSSLSRVRNHPAKKRKTQPPTTG